MNKVLNTLGLAYKAKKVVFGDDILDNFNKVKLLIIASNISDKSRIRFLNKCEYYNVDYIDEFSSEEISKALGKANIKTVGIIDEGFKKPLLK